MSSTSKRPHHGLIARAALAIALLVVILACAGVASAANSLDVSPYAPPTVSFGFSPAAVQAGVPETFTATATPGTGATIGLISWDLGSGNFGDASGASVTKTFAISGTEEISVQVTQSDGQTATSTQSITVAPAAGSILAPAIVIKPKLRLVSAKVSGERVSVKLSCAFAVCRTSASLTTVERRRRGRLTALTAAAKVKTRTTEVKTRTTKVGSTDIRVEPGRTATYTLKLNRAGRNLLRRFRRLPLTLSLSNIRRHRHLTIRYVAPHKKHGKR